MKRFFPAFLLLLFVAIGLVIALLEFSSTIRVPGRVLPRLEWALTYGERGQLVAVLRDNLEGATKRVRVIDFDRGDQVNFTVHTRSGAAVSIGDTMVSLHSVDLQSQLVKLQGQLDVELGALAMSAAGGKVADIEEAELVLDYRRTQLDWHENEMVRLRSLREQGLLSPADFEEAENELALRKVKVDIAAAGLQSIVTGAKERELDWRQTRANALRAELDVLRQRLEQSAILSPVAGRIGNTPARDTLAVVRDTTAHFAVMLVRWRERDHFVAGRQVEFQVEGVDHYLRGEIAVVGREVQLLNGEQFVMVKALLSSGGGTALVPGMIVHCVMERAAVGPWEFIRQL